MTRFTTPAEEANVSVSAATLRAAAEVLRANDRDGATVPCPDLYPGQWLWDAAFTSIGWAALDGGRAFDELDRVMAGQWPDGMCPHIVFFDEDPAYFPGPREWGTHRDPPTSGITQPPILGSMLALLVDQARDLELAERRARALWDRVWINHRWWHTARDPERRGLVCSYHPWESGMDDSPAWDGPLGRVEVDDLPPYRRRDLSVVSAAERPTGRDYDRYYALVLEGRALSWDADELWRHASFRVADVLTNATLLRADADLARLGRRLGMDAARCAELDGWVERGTVGLELLWDDATGHYRSIDLTAQGEFVGPATVASLIAPWSGAVPEHRVARLAATARAWCEATGMGLPSVDPSFEGFEPVRYWRGASWLDTNWLASRGFAGGGEVEIAERIRASCARLIEGSGFAEYFDPTSGAGHGCQEFSTSAALTLSWLAG